MVNSEKILHYEKIHQIEKEIKKEIEKEFDLIKKEIMFFLDHDFDLYFLKEFLRHYPSKTIRERAELLLESLLNYYMKDLLDFIKTLEPEKQYLFFRENLRDKIKTKALGELNNIIPVSVNLGAKRDIENKLPIIGSIALSTGGIATAIIIPESLLIKSLPASSSLLASFYLLKTYKDTNKRLKRMWKKILNKFLDENKEMIKKWLEQTQKEIILEINKLLQILSQQSEYTTNKFNFNIKE